MSKSLTTEIDLGLDSFSQERGVSNENHVSHVKFEGDIFVQQSPGSLVPYWDTTLPQDYFPDGLMVVGSNGQRIMSAYRGTIGDLGRRGRGDFSIAFAKGNHITIMSTLNFNKNTGRSVWSYRDEIWITEVNPITRTVHYERASSENPVYVMSPVPATPQGVFDSLMSASKAVGAKKLGQTAYVEVDLASIEAVVNSLAFAAHRLIKTDPPKDLYEDWGILSHEASQRLYLTQTNFVEFLVEMKHPERLIPRLLELKKLRDLAGLHLQTTFGILPTISDIQEIVDMFTRKIKLRRSDDRYRIGRAGSSRELTDNDLTLSVKQHMKLMVSSDDEELTNLCARFSDLGVFPSLENLWDLVPFSFVVDWLVDVGDFLERSTSRSHLERYVDPIVVRSTKVIKELDLASPTSLMSGQLRQVTYHRSVGHQIPIPPASLTTPMSLRNHWLEAGALIIQRASK